MPGQSGLKNKLHFVAQLSKLRLRSQLKSCATYLFSMKVIQRLGFKNLHIALELFEEFKIIESAVVLNGIVGLLFGWSLLNYGLEAAMFCHIFLHLVWYPIERNKRTTRMSFEDAQIS